MRFSSYSMIDDAYFIEERENFHLPSKVHRFNPTIFFHNQRKYCLFRQETDVVNFYKSHLSYYLTELDRNNKMIHQSLQCQFRVGDKTYSSILRENVTDGYCTMEDIKIFPNRINQKIYGVANTLVQASPKVVRSCIVCIHVAKLEIELIKILTVPEISAIEKNWYPFQYREKYYMILRLFPEFVCYELNTNDFSLDRRRSMNFFTQLEDSKIMMNLYRSYRDLYMTCVSILPLKEGTYQMITKVRKKNGNYEYYLADFQFSDKYIDLKVNLKPYFIGSKYFLNDVKQKDNKIIECWGIQDHTFDFQNRIFS